MSDIIEELVKQISKLQHKIDNWVIPESYPAVISTFQHIPGLVGFWPFSSIQRSTGNVYDLSGQGRTLTYRGNPVYSDWVNIVPHIVLDGAGDYVDRADETDLDITGTETIFPARLSGLTIGGWFYFDTPAAASNYGLMFKGTNALGTLAYWLTKLSAGPTVSFRVSVDGTAITNVTSTVTLVASTWYFIVGRFIPSTSLDIFVNNVQTTNLVAIPASIFNSAQPFAIGAAGGTSTGLNMPGRAALCFLSANAISSQYISLLYQLSKKLFRV